MKWTEPTTRAALILGLMLAGASSVARAQVAEEGAQSGSASEIDDETASAAGPPPDPDARAARGAGEDRDAPGGQGAGEGPGDEEDVAVPPTVPLPRAGTGERVSFEPGRGVTFRSDDDEFALTIGLRGQFRGAVRVPNAGDASVDLIIRRARLDFSGHFFGEHNRFELELAFSPDDLDWSDAFGPRYTPILDFALTFDHLRDLTVVIGQRKMPFARERLVSSRDLAMNDRSIVDDELSLDRDLGVWLRSDDLFGAGFFRYWVGVSAGEGRDGLVGDDADLAYMARIELLPLGLFDSYTQGDLERNPRPRLAFGLAYAYVDDSRWVDGIGGTLPEDGGTTDTHAAAFDAVFLWGGFTGELDVLMRYGERNPGTAGPVTAPSNGAGGFVQLSYLLPDTIVEITARYAMVMGIGDVTSFEDRTELGGAVSLYFEGHALKLQLDYFHLWGEAGAIDQGDELVRLQLQGVL